MIQRLRQAIRRAWETFKKVVIRVASVTWQLLRKKEIQDLILETAIRIIVAILEHSSRN